MNFRSLTASFLCLSIAWLTGACVNHDLDNLDQNPDAIECSSKQVSYTTDVAPIIAENCAMPGCHNGSTPLPDWTKQSDLAANGSEVQRRITLPSADPGKMPKSGSITETERQTIYCWIEQGAKNN